VAKKALSNPSGWKSMKVRADTFNRLHTLRADLIRAGTAALPKDIAPVDLSLSEVIDLAVRIAEQRLNGALVRKR